MNVFLWRKGMYEKAPDLWSCVKWVTIKRPAKKKAPRKMQPSCVLRGALPEAARGNKV